jgi:hypothetical protein
MTPLAGFENLPCPHIISLDAPAFSISLSRTSSDNRFGDRNPALLRTHIADCSLRNDYTVRVIIITQLEQVVMQCNVISFQILYGSTIWRAVCLFLYINLRIYNRVKFAYKATRFQYKLWEKHDITWPPSNYLYLFVWAKLCILFIFFQTVLL